MLLQSFVASRTTPTRPSFACVSRAPALALAAFASVALGGAAPLRAQAPRLVIPTEGALVRGMPTGLAVDGLARGDTATLVAWRRVVLRREDGSPDTVALRAVAHLAGARGGRVALDDATPLAGSSWTRRDPLALLWSMEPRDTVLALAPGRVALALAWRGAVVDSATLAVRSAASSVTRRWVAGEGFAGALALPAGPGPHPVVLALHGSEGGDSASARGLAEAFANHGFATLALTYVDYSGRIPGVPSSFVNIPVEMLDRARAWLGAQPGVDTSRTGLWGGSKGAELALVAASRRTWPRAVVACVPSDVVWSGFGRATAPGERLSSWSDGGVGLPYVPYDRYEDVFARRATARVVHDRSRALHADSVAAATIPLERTRARLLLAGSERDELWASGDMTRAVGARLTRAVRAGQVRTLVHAGAGHGICGTGGTPWPAFAGSGWRRAGAASTATDALALASASDPRATARAAAETWWAGVQFLQDGLGLRRVPTGRGTRTAATRGQR